jgi:hypothetical protein
MDPSQYGPSCGPKSEDEMTLPVRNQGAIDGGACSRMISGASSNTSSSIPSVSAIPMHGCITPHTTRRVVAFPECRTELATRHQDILSGVSRLHQRFVSSGAGCSLAVLRANRRQEFFSSIPMDRAPSARLFPAYAPRSPVGQRRLTTIAAASPAETAGNACE